MWPLEFSPFESFPLHQTLRQLLHTGEVLLGSWGKQTVILFVIWVDKVFIRMPQIIPSEKTVN